MNKLNKVLLTLSFCLATLSANNLCKVISKYKEKEIEKKIENKPEAVKPFYRCTEIFEYISKIKPSQYNNLMEDVAECFDKSKKPGVAHALRSVNPSNLNIRDQYEKERITRRTISAILSQDLEETKKEIEKIEIEKLRQVFSEYKCRWVVDLAEAIEKVVNQKENSTVLFTKGDALEELDTIKCMEKEHLLPQYKDLLSRIDLSKLPPEKAREIESNLAQEIIQLYSS